MRAGNPFSAPRFAPGAIPFLFPPGQSLELFLQRLRASRWRGQIVGPHGTGKSTLIATLLPFLKQERTVHTITRRRGDTRLPAAFWHALRQTTAPWLVVVDGYEQLGLWSRLRLAYASRGDEAGLLVTSHTDCGLPVLYRSHVTGELAHQLVTHLTGDPQSTPRPDVLAAHLRRHGGNVREVFFDLYDQHEAAREDGFG